LLDKYGQRIFQTESEKKAFRRRRNLINCIKEVGCFLPENWDEEEKIRVAINVLDEVKKEKKMININKFQEGKNMKQILNWAREKLISDPHNLRLVMPLPDDYVCCINILYIKFRFKLCFFATSLSSWYRITSM
jgi:hypothetical protein